MRSVSDSFSRWILQLSAHPHLRELYYRGIHDFDSLEGADLVGFGVWMLEGFRQYEELYYQRSEGQLGPRLWRGFEGIMRDVSGYPGIQAWWRSRSHWFSEEFANHVNQLQQTAKPPRLYREPNGMSFAMISHAREKHHGKKDCFVPGANAQSRAPPPQTCDATPYSPSFRMLLRAREG
jgi:hypothetical protein